MHTDQLHSPLRSILVDILPEGTLVHTGEVAAILDTEEISSTITDIESWLQANQISQTISSLQAEMDKIRLDNAMLEASYEVALKKMELDLLKPSERELKPLRMEISHTGVMISELQKQLQDLQSMAKKGFVSDQELLTKKKELFLKETSLEKLKLDLALKESVPEIDTRKKEAELLTANHALSIAKLRIETHTSQELINRDNTLLRVRLEQNKLDQYRQKLEWLTVRSPATGTLVYAESWSGGKTQKISKGSSFWEGEPVASIQSLDRFSISFSVPQFYLMDIHVSDEIS
ncbi:MAG: hypothetical protein PHQ23_17420, partial [Candidatus Wallbacteria bacterium]|nr:hypothetical protein [Candidatus Wallbacteria bacterium]